MSEEWAESFAKDVGANKTVKIPLNFFAEKGLDSHGPTQIRKGMPQQEAHDLTNKTYNYTTAIIEWRTSNGKNKKHS